MIRAPRTRRPRCPEPALTLLAVAVVLALRYGLELVAAVAG